MALCVDAVSIKFDPSDDGLMLETLDHLGVDRVGVLTDS